MARTRQELVYRALKNLGVLPQGQDPSDEEFNTVDDEVDGLIEDLIERDVYFLEDVDAIPEAAFRHLGHVLAWACSSEFGMQDDVALAAKSEKAEKDLEAIQATRPTYQPLEVQSF